MGDAAGHLADGGQSFAPLLATDVFCLVGIFDDREVEIQKGVQRAADAHRFLRLALPAGLQGQQQPAAEAGQGHVGVNLVQPDFDMAPADAPAPRDIVAIVGAEQEFPQPAAQRPLEAIDLCRAARDDLACLGVTFDLGVEIVDERHEVSFQQRSHRPNPHRIRIGPADIPL